MPTTATLLDKIWSAHAIETRADGATLLSIDRHLVHDGSSTAFRSLKERGLAVRRPDRTFATPDHYVSTLGRTLSAINDPNRRGMVEDLEANTRRTGVTLFGLADRRQGIVHVIGPEQGLSQPGMVIVCGDSHTATHGAVGALAFGVGASEVTHVLATQTLWQIKPKNMRITVDGDLAAGVHAKDVILAIIAKISAAGGVGHVHRIRGLGHPQFEHRRPADHLQHVDRGRRAGGHGGARRHDVRVSERPALCTQGCRLGHGGRLLAHAAVRSRSGVRPRGAPGCGRDRADGDVGHQPRGGVPHHWRGAGPGVGLGCRWPRHHAARARLHGPEARHGAFRYRRRSRVHRLVHQQPHRGPARRRQGRRGRRAVVPALVVPGSGLVKAQAEAESLDAIFKRAGFEWREAGCSMCVGINGDLVAAGERCASTSNRNFVGRQGKGARTHLMSPAMAAAAAVTGKLTDVRQLMRP